MSAVPSPHAAPSFDQLFPVTTFFPSWTPRRVNENCREGRIPGAVRVGRTWMMTATAYARFTTGRDARGVPSIEDAYADLRRRGVL
jgi:hypothetical protein